MSVGGWLPVRWLIVTSSLHPQAVGRLAFARYLHGRGIDHAQRPYPISAAAILDFHDAVELFYGTALDHVGVQLARNTQFEEYWDKLAAKVPGLPGRASMRNLNAVRVQLKHHGVIPGAQQVATFRAEVTAFLTDACQLVFDLDWASVSMADLIPQRPVQDKVKAAQVAEAAGDRTDAMGLLAEALDQLLHPGSYEYREDRTLELGRTFALPYRQREDTIRRTLSDLRNNSGRGQHVDVSGLARHISTMGEVVTASQAALRVMATGMSYPRYLRFMQLVPAVFGTIDGARHRAVPDDYAPTPEHYVFCEQLVMEYALQAAEVDRYLEPPSWIRR